jgi:HAD superfamily hydrolase (TIGR01450 family)
VADDRAPGTTTVDARDLLADVRGYVFDMDGTLVLGDRRNQGLRPLPGAVELLHELDRHAVPFLVMTNGTTRTPELYARTLRDLGFPVAEERLFTPATGAVEALRERGHGRVLVLGHAGLRDPVADAGFTLVEPEGHPEADAVLVGWYPDFTLAPLEAACHAVWGGAEVFSASQSLFFATAAGRTLGTSRAICGMIEAVTGVAPEIVGKPSQLLLRAAARRLDVPVGDLAVVGDDPALELRMARRAGALAVAVRTGVADDTDLADLVPEERPDLVLDGVVDLLERFG